MVIDTRLVPEGHSDVEREADLSAYRGDLPPLRRPLVCRAALDRAGADIVVSLRFDGEFEVECARCLAPVGVAVGGEMGLVLRERAVVRGKRSSEVVAVGGDEGVDFFFDAVDGVVDLGPAVYDEVMVALPMMPLCSEGCAGAWAVAGDGGGEREVDPRWAGLLKYAGG